jgi:hypothetical protein
MNSGYIKIIISIILAFIIIFIRDLYIIGNGIGNIFSLDKDKNKTDNRILYSLIIPIILGFWGIYDLVKI